MTTEDSAARFLELENSASRLLDELEQLRRETSNYEQASTSLESVEQNVRGLATSLGSVTEQLHSLVTGLRDVGMPELLDRMNAMEAQLVEARRESAEELGSRMDALMHQVADTQESLNAANEFAQSLETRVDHSAKETQRAQVDLAQQLSALLEYHSRGFFGKLIGKPRRVD